MAACLAGPRLAHAGVDAWRINEVSASNAGDSQNRFVELYAPPSATADNCFFPSTRLEILAADGSLLGAVTPFGTTTCYGGDTYFLFAPPGAGAFYGVTRDATLPYDLPSAGGQVCLRSSSTRYDCVRWGTVTMPITDFAAPGDTTSAPALVDGASLVRVSDTNVVATDFVLAMPPTPRGPNDGTPWFPPDAGPPADAAPPPPDAAPRPDARTVSADAGVPLADARLSPPAWLNADPGGSGCSIGHPPRSMGTVFTLSLVWCVALIARRRR